MKIENYYQPQILEHLRLVIPTELDVFHHIYFQQDTPLLNSNSVKDQTHHELGARFQISGDLKGHVYCFLDTYQADLEGLVIRDLQNVLREGCNILLGNTLSKLEQFNTWAILSPPDQVHDQSIPNNSLSRLLSTNYKLFYNLKEFHLRVIFSLREI